MIQTLIYLIVNYLFNFTFNLKRNLFKIQAKGFLAAPLMMLLIFQIFLIL